MDSQIDTTRRWLVLFWNFYPKILRYLLPLWWIWSQDQREPGPEPASSSSFLTYWLLDLGTTGLFFQYLFSLSANNIFVLFLPASSQLQVVLLQSPSNRTASKFPSVPPQELSSEGLAWSHHAETTSCRVFHLWYSTHPILTSTTVFQVHNVWPAHSEWGSFLVTAYQLSQRIVPHSRTLEQSLHLLSASSQLRMAVFFQRIDSLSSCSSVAVSLTLATISDPPVGLHFRSASSNEIALWQPAISSSSMFSQIASAEWSSKLAGHPSSSDGTPSDCSTEAAIFVISCLLFSLLEPPSPLFPPGSWGVDSIRFGDAMGGK